MKKLFKTSIYLAYILLFVFTFTACNLQSVQNPLPSPNDQQVIVPKENNGSTTQDIQKFTAYQQGSLRIDFIDIGQGDCIFIIFPDNKSMLIDGGSTPFANSSAIVECLNFYQIKQIDYLMLTHPHADHCNSLTAILKKYSVKEFFLPLLLPSYSKANARKLKGHYDNKTYYKFYQEVEKQVEKGAVLNYNVGIFSIIGENYSFDFYCYEAEAYQEISGASSNNKVNALSPIGFLFYNEIRYCFTGDSNVENETYFLSNYTLADIASESFLLKVAHHGSKTSSTAEFLSVINPKVGVICVGANIYGHPTNEALGRLYNIGATVYNTRDNGLITVSQIANEVTVAPVIGESYYFFVEIFSQNMRTFSMLLYIIPHCSKKDCSIATDKEA